LRAGAIAAAVGKSLLTVRRWRRRYVVKGVDKDATRPSRVKPLAPEMIKRVVHMTLHEKPPNATQWSMRIMAKVAGISYSSIQRIWLAHGLKPHLVKTFKVSRDKDFAAKVTDVVGLYLNPPDKALVLCVDLEEPNPGARPDPARLADEEGPRRHHDARLQVRRHHDPVCGAQHAGRKGDRDVHAAPSAPRVPALSQLIDQKTPADLDLHLIVDNSATHKTPAVKRWLKSHPRFHLHFTPTSASWLNMVERLQTHPARPSRVSPSSKAPSWNTWRPIMPTPSPSSGPSPQPKSSKKSLARNTC
jgi:transposase